METGHFLTDHHGLEQSLRAAETLRTDSDDLSVRKFVSLVVLGRVIVSYIRSEFTGHFCFVIQSHITELFLDVSDSLTLSR